MRFAQIVAGRVHGLFEYDVLPAFASNIVMVPVDGLDPEPQPGWLYDGVAFSAPDEADPDAARWITRLAFLSRFTDAEAVAIDLASMGATVEAATMRLYMSKVNAATYIDLDRADLRDGLLAVETAGILAAGRALEILDAPVQDIERYRG